MDQLVKENEEIKQNINILIQQNINILIEQQKKFQDNLINHLSRIQTYLSDSITSINHEKKT